jgi:ANTAR domain
VLDRSIEGVLAPVETATAMRGTTAAGDERLRELVVALAARNGQLEQALESRIVIEQAKGMLAERHRLDLAEAFEVIRRASRSNGLRAHAVARMILDEPETPELVLEALRRHLSRR